MAQRVYHWKHGWIPLDHAAALSKAKGSQSGAQRYLSPVSQTDLPRRSHIVAGHSNGKFVVHDKKTGHTATLTETHGDRLQSGGHTITAVNADGGVSTTEKHAGWTPSKPEHDGTPAGIRAAAKVKQSFKLDKHTVHIETDMTPEQTKALLADVHSALSKHHGPAVTVRVPAGDRHFNTKNGLTGGYVHEGTSTLTLNPKVADGSVDASLKDTDLSGQLMPSVSKVGFRRYTIQHELGHVSDNQHDHTHGAGLTAQGRPAPHKLKADAEALFKQHRGEMSKYGKTNATEAYAEAYAQWHLGGPGTSAVADAYARNYGWT